jgi:hypothetical protein
MTVPEAVRGKKVRCKGCGGVVPVPAGRGPDTRMTTAQAQAKKAADAVPKEDDPKNPYGVTETSLAPRCPHCAYELDPPDARICLHCGYDMVRRARAGSIKAYERTFGDWFLWLAPGVACLIGLGLVVGACLYYHFYLPEQVFDTWAKNAQATGGDRFETVSKVINDESLLALMFHPGIETWVIVMGIWVSWKLLRYAFKRLVLNYMPPEKIKHK